MLSRPAAPALPSPLPSLFGSLHDEGRVSRASGLAACAHGLLAASLYALLPAARGGLAGLLAISAVLGLGGVGWWASRRRPVPRLRTTIAVTGWLLMGQIGLVTFALGAGLHSAAIGLQALMLVLVAAANGPRGRAGGIALALGSAACVLALGLAEAAGGPVLLAVLLHLLVLAAALALGSSMAWLLARQGAATAEREARFRGLLHCAADWYWELDAELRFTHIDEPAGARAAAPGPSRRLGRHPWELALGLSDAELAGHRADLQAHRAFQDLIVTRHGPGGSPRHVAISGEPRHDAAGRFMGYLGVGRDVTHEVAQRASAASARTLYQEVFQRSLAPLLLERDGVVLDANPAALSLFGHAGLGQLRAAGLLEHFDAHDGSRQRARERGVRLDRLEAGAGLPPEDYVVHAADGRRLLLRGTDVRVDAGDGPATLTTFSDETERHAQADAVHRSEALLAHLVATSPDAIALVDARSERFTMVNRTFCSVFGYTNDEVIGRSPAELGIWQSPAQHQQLMVTLAANRRVEAMPATLRDRRGSLFAMLVSAGRFSVHGRDYLVLNARDVSHLERTRSFYEAVLQNASIGIGCTRDGLVVQANKRLSEMFGWPDGGLVGQAPTVIWPNEEDLELQLTTLSPRLDSGELVEFERPLRRRDGSQLWCRIHGQQISTPYPELGGMIWIIEDISEQRAAARALALAYEAAEAASRAKSAFLANTSHELRTPLNALLGLARLAQDEATEPARRRRYIDQIADSAQTLADIINDILDLSKIEAGKLEIESVPFDLQDKISALQRAYMPLAEARKLELRFEFDAELPRFVLGDPVRVRQIVSNFLTNALKFTTQGQVTIRVKAGAVLPTVRFEVEDTGPGISPELRTRLFTPFTQADESTTRRFGGTGLGLSICRELGTLMKGEVGVDSVLGKGSLFWAELPLPKDVEDPLVTQYSTFHGHDPLRGAHLLVVEDNPVNMMICVALLEQQGVRVSQAENGQAALDAIDQARHAGELFDAVLMDMQMPVMGGQEATRILRQTYTPSQLPIIALTAAALVSEREQAIAAGMNAFLTKPIDPRRLVRALARALVG